MKFTGALLSLLALPSVQGQGTFVYPPGLVEQCCITAEVGLFSGPGGVTTCDGISGIVDGTCNGETGDLHPLCEAAGAVVELDPYATCMTSEEICDSLEVEGGKDVFICSDGYNCCDIGNDDSENVVGDIPWTCGSILGFSPGYMGNLQNDDTRFNIPDLRNQTGFYCGAENECKLTGIFCGGDPHFKTWADEWYDFHGECDLQFLEDKEFAKGLGLDIQIRTKARYEYSYIESAAVSIGDDVLEVGAYGQYFLNGVENANMKNVQMGGLMDVSHEVSDDQKSHMFTIYTGVSRGSQEETIKIKSFKDLVSVNIQNAFAETFGRSTGMMGSFHSGARLARDGKSIIEDDVMMGMEWQVPVGAPELFQVSKDRSEKCVMPSKNASAERRRLGETVSEQAAEAACAAVDHVHHDSCVYDVMATGDLESAHAGVF